LFTAGKAEAALPLPTVNQSRDTSIDLSVVVGPTDMTIPPAGPYPPTAHTTVEVSIAAFFVRIELVGEAPPPEPPHAVIATTATAKKATDWRNRHGNE
jgi:hypothetical protein